MTKPGTAPKAFRTPAAFRAWLERNHGTATELEIRLFKVHAAHRGITYSQALDEALCFGWIDGVTHSLDNDSYRQRFTPRRARSTWSRRNVEHVARLTSSVAALGVPRRINGNLPEPIDETHAWNFPAHWWPYGYAKYMAELEVQRAVAMGLDAVIVNPAVVLGPGDLNRVSGEVVIQITRHRPPIAPTGGLNVIHISDVTRGHLAALERGCTGHRYILGSENMTHLQFLQLVSDVIGKHPPRIVFPAALFRLAALPLSTLAALLHIPLNVRTLRRAGVYFYYQNRKAQKDLGFASTRSTSQSIQEAYDWYCQWK